MQVFGTMPTRSLGTAAAQEQWVAAVQGQKMAAARLWGNCRADGEPSVGVS